MAESSLSARILDVLDLAMRPLAAAEIRRWIPDDVGADELASCLVKMEARKEVIVTKVPRKAKTGPSLIKAYSAVAEQQKAS
jgi:hypothetical protein